MFTLKFSKNSVNYSKKFSSNCFMLEKSKKCLGFGVNRQNLLDKANPYFNIK